LSVASVVVDVTAAHSLHATLCCLLVLVLVCVVAPSTAAPPPRPLCDACGEPFEATAEAHGLALSVERSVATVTVHRNGSATWLVRNRLGDTGTAERLRSNTGLLTDVADGAMWDAEFLGASVSGDVVTLRYREAGFAERSVGGVFRSGAFTERYGYRTLDGLGADHLVVVAPDGTAVDWAVPGATVSGDAGRMTLTDLERGFVTFTPRSSLLGPLFSFLAVVTLVGPTVALNALVGIGLPAATFGLFVGALGGALSWLAPDLGRVRRRAGVGLATAGVLATLLAFVASVSVLGGAAAPVVGVGVAFVVFGAALSRPPVRESVSYRGLVAAAALGVVLAAGSTLAAALATNQNGLTRSLLASLPPLAPVFALLPTGYALGRGRRRLAVGTAMAGAVLALLPTVSLVSPRGGSAVLVVPLAAAYAVGIVLLGAPLLVAGASLGEFDAGRAAGDGPSGHRQP